ncbi:NADPH-dependent FMN reductase [Lichenihabitans psoromatis]|uniref:NADPH-dependent FMN reductase n=1 Tax=Lichenihabitans psoromatis TaxID=2528642 RepID=UPI0010384C4E|nr:NADPH-dependent FMN reductase [Lichenihabitans psoromatis]
MKFLAISGSGRRASTNTAMLRALSSAAQPDHQVTVYDGIGDLQIFCPDFEAKPLPRSVQDFADLIGQSDGLIIASPEYVRAIPGGLKNAIDWFVSRKEIVHKPVVLMHASQRGDDMLAQLRIVLSTVSSRFNEDIFLRYGLMKMSPDEIEAYFETGRPRAELARFICRLAAHCSYSEPEADVFLSA